MKEFVIIVAAGSGTRMHAALPKQFMQINGKPILQYALEKFHRYEPTMEILLVLHPDYVQFWIDLARTLQIEIPHKVIVGGEERFHSVKNAIAAIDEENGIVGIHDAVRPLVSLRTIETCYNTARQRSNAIPVIRMHESIRVVNETGSSSADRNKFRIVQTPQCFELSLLKSAFEQPFDASFTDEASVVEALGERLNLVEGNRENIKITTTEDLRMAAALLLE